MIIGHKFTLYERDYIRIYEIQNSFLMKKAGLYILKGCRLGLSKYV